MADQYLNKVGLQYLWNRLKSYFVDQTTFQALEDTVDGLVTEGGEPNVIESVSVNGTAQTVADKNVDITVPTATSDLTNDGDGTSNFATEDYVDANGGKIDAIKVNGTAQTITNKEVDITVPTKVSDLTNDGDGTAGSAFATTDEVDDAIAAAVTSAYKYKGSVANQAALPASGNETGDVYDVQDTGMNYAWNGTAWDPLGTYVDMSLYWAVADLTAITTAEIDTITEATNANSGN